MRKRTVAFYVFLVLTIGWLFFMLWLSHQDGEHTNRISRGLVEYLKFLGYDAQVLNKQIRKAAHIIVFLVLTVLFGLTLHYGQKQMWILGFTIVLAWADEITKIYIEGRHFAWTDVGLNLCGIAMGLIIVGVVWLCER